MEERERTKLSSCEAPSFHTINVAATKFSSSTRNWGAVFSWYGSDMRMCFSFLLFFLLNMYLNDQFGTIYTCIYCCQDNKLTTLYNWGNIGTDFLFQLSRIQIFISFLLIVYVCVLKEALAPVTQGNRRSLFLAPGQQRSPQASFLCPLSGDHTWLCSHHWFHHCLELFISRAGTENAHEKAFYMLNQ